MKMLQPLILMALISTLSSCGDSTSSAKLHDGGFFSNYPTPYTIKNLIDHDIRQLTEIHQIYTDASLQKPHSKLAVVSIQNFDGFAQLGVTLDRMVRNDAVILRLVKDLENKINIKENEKDKPVYLWTRDSGSEYSVTYKQTLLEDNTASLQTRINRIRAIIPSTDPEAK